MTFGEYLAGSIELLVVLGALGFGALRLRAGCCRAGPAPRPGSPRSSSGISLLVVVAGADRGRRPLPARLGPGRRHRGGARDRPRRAAPSAARRVELPAPPVVPRRSGSRVAAPRCWSPPTGRCRPRSGSTSACTCRTPPGTTPPSPPASSRTHQVGALHMTEVLKLTVWFYPQNSELLHSAGILFLGTDFLSPLMNIGWMALCLLAAWSFGRPYGAARHRAARRRAGPRRRDAAALPARRRQERHRRALLPAGGGGDPRQRRGAGARRDRRRPARSQEERPRPTPPPPRRRAAASSPGRRPDARSSHAAR